MTPPVIGLIGASGAGKSSVAELLTVHGYTRLAMSCVLKDMLRALGFTDADLEGDQAYRLTPQERFGGMSPREVASSLGTEWARDIVHPDLLRNAVRGRIAKLLADGKKVALDGVRFPNEWAMCWNMGGEVWMIRRPSVEPRRTAWDRFCHRYGFHPRIHESEYHWRDCIGVDAVLFNTSTRLSLLDQVERRLER